MRCALASTLFAAVTVCTVASGAPAVADPTSGTQIGSVTNEPGTVSFVLSADPNDGRIDPSSVVVTANGRALDATAASVDGAAQPGTTRPRDVYVVLDSSGSMAGAGIGAARAAAAQYAKSLPQDVGLGLISFADRPVLELTASRDRAAFVRGLARIHPGGGTSLYDAVQMAARQLSALPTSSQRRVLILSDGDDTSSRTSQSAALRELRTQGIAADVVAFRVPGNLKVLHQIALNTHGVTLGAASADKLATAFATAARVFRPELKVTTQVPPSLAGHAVQMTVRAQQGARTVTATTSMTLAVVDTPHAAAAPSTGTPETTSRMLWIVVAIAFLACLVIAFMGLFGPALAAERKRRSLRLAEVGRYRVVGAAGTRGGALSVVPSSGSAANSAIGRQALRAADQVLRSRGIRQRVAADLDGAGLRVRPEEWAILYGVIVLVAAVVMEILLRSVVGLLVGALLGIVGTRMYLRRRRRRREEQFIQQLPDTLQLIGGSVRAGFSLQQALGIVVREGTEPTASEFARSLTEARLGADLEDALDGTADRMRCQDLSWVVMAVRICREVGGNLAEVIGTTVVTMRQRAELRGTVRSLSAEGRISAKILLGLPFVVAVGVSFLRPGYLDPLFTTPAGLAMVIGAGVLLVVGMFWISRLVKIEV